MYYYASIMTGTKIYRYIYKEVFFPTLLCLLIFTMVLLMGRLTKLVDLVVNKGVSIGDILVLFGTMLPVFLHVTLPLSFLMGIMIGLSRMSYDNETIALKSVGIGLGQIARPILMMAILISVFTALAGLWLKPWGYHKFKKQVFAITLQKATIGFQPQVFMRQFDNMTLYANSLDERSGKMEGLFILEEKPDATMLIFAKEGHIIANEQDETLIFRLEKGTIHRQVSAENSTYQLIHFHNYDLQPDITEGSEKLKKSTHERNRPKEMTSADLWEQINKEDPNLINPKIHAFNAEFHSRLVSPLAPLLFALFALPFSIQSHRSGRSGGFVIGLIIYLIYYLILSLAQTLTAEAEVTPWISFWLTHVLIFVIGIYLFHRSANESRNIVISWVDQTIKFFKKHQQN